MSVPLALTMRGVLRERLGSSLAAGEAADAVNYDWWQEFQGQASGLATTFTPSVVGFAAVLHNISGVVDGRAPITPLAAVLAAYLLVWTFVAGGITDRFARQRPTRAHGFFAASGVFFLRFIRLAAVAGLAYWLLFGFVHGWLFDDLYRRVTLDVNAERVAFAWRLALYLAFGVLLVTTNILFDFARIRAVVEDRRSVALALVASARFVRRHAGRVFGLYALNAAAFLCVIALWSFVAPGAGSSGFSMWAVFVVTQVYIAARLFLKLHFIASETALFQASLAHAAYAAAPLPAWPESPGAEAIRTGELT
jgi:hypothetical protein